MIELILGPMRSGKSTELVRRVSIQRVCKRNILIVSCGFDSRSGAQIATHSGLSVSCNAHVNTHLSEIFQSEFFNNADVIVFDEAHFYPDLVETVSKINELGKTVICAGLSGTFAKTPFENISALISIADDVTFLKGICTCPVTSTEICGNPAPFTMKTSGSSSNVLQVGASEYTTCCSKHWKLLP